MTTRIVWLKSNDYYKYDATTYILKNAMQHGTECYTTESGMPIFINLRVDGFWGYIDGNGRKWKVEWL
jgi:hypothetical protein